MSRLPGTLPSKGWQPDIGDARINLDNTRGLFSQPNSINPAHKLSSVEHTSSGIGGYYLGKHQASGGTAGKHESAFETVGGKKSPSSGA